LDLAESGLGKFSNQKPDRDGNRWDERRRKEMIRGRSP